MIIQKPVPSYTVGRGSIVRPDLIVIHIGEGSQQVIYNTFLTEEKSSHYCVSKTGEIWQFVQEKDTAWGNGTVVNPTSPLVLSRPNLNPNKYSISIEHEGMATSDITEIQYTATANLVEDICKRWNIPIDRIHIIPHKEIRADKSCPGLINVEKIISMASPASPPETKVEQARKLLQQAIVLLS